MSSHLTSIFSLTAAVLMLAMHSFHPVLTAAIILKKDTHIHTQTLLFAHILHAPCQTAIHTLFYVGSNSRISTHLSHMYSTTDTNMQTNGSVCNVLTEHLCYMLPIRDKRGSMFIDPAICCLGAVSPYHC